MAKPNSTALLDRLPDGRSRFVANRQRTEARALDKGMGVAVARRTVFRDEDKNDWNNVADRVAIGNIGLVSDKKPVGVDEAIALRNSIATAALITSGRHLQHGDKDQKKKNMELHTNCSTAIASFPQFYLLLNGSGVGRAYDDELQAVDWAKAPRIKIALSKDHPDYPKTNEKLFEFGKEFNLLPFGTNYETFLENEIENVREWIEANIDTEYAVSKKDYANGVRPVIPAESEVDNYPTSGYTYHRVDDSREGWGKALEIYEAMTFADGHGKTLILDYSDVRELGAPIKGMQNRPASGPLSVMRAFINIRNNVVTAAQAGMEMWEQAMRVDHYTSTEVQVGGARRAARMSTKNWRDKQIGKFIRIKSEGGLWTSNNSVMVDQEFWDCVRTVNEIIKSRVSKETLEQFGTEGVLQMLQKRMEIKPIEAHAYRVFSDVTAYSYKNGEPGFINGDLLDSHASGKARKKPVYKNGDGFGSSKYRADHGNDLLEKLAEMAKNSQFPMTTNPCGEVELHVTGGYCVVGDYIPLFSCPFDFMERVGFGPISMTDEEAYEWDTAVEESVRLGTRFLMRVNQMEALYGKEVERTNRIGPGPTGFHEYAWTRFGLGFRDMLDEEKAKDFWQTIKRFSDAAKDESHHYAAELGVEVPHTVTTIKPAGTTSKLWGLTEGAHLPPQRQYVRWVQFKGARDHNGEWTPDSNPLLAEYEAKGYPIRTDLPSFPNTAIVGFPTAPLITKLGMGDALVTAPEATPEEQYQYIKLLEKYWLGDKQANQVSYTLKVYTDQHDLDGYRDIVLSNQPNVKCCSVMPSKPDSQMGYDYLPEQEIELDKFMDLVDSINDDEMKQEIDMRALQCASGACPI